LIVRVGSNQAELKKDFAMTNRTTVVTTADQARLRNGINVMVGDSGVGEWASVRRLEDALQHAQTLDRSQIPDDVVTMNSTVLLRNLENETVKMYTLVYPSYEAAEDDMISVLTPLGTALLGARAGDEVEYEDAGGLSHRLAVADVLYQPEAAGHAFL
jgi:regulator of nucleoside diphosphate kinase